uniref:DNA mismatch repair protein MutS core domain-containing protein n=2 Tax=Rhodosorus marinus TaxID=101924 RepID=A0A7S3A6E1_9RHOD|mmetsp:Transcript_45378/g.176331  ORF Transcript_45378/g.176331 Transcript_45378/m.176331 type:complete len:321 (+) Transcript_45378:748-1710(+)
MLCLQAGAPFYVNDIKRFVPENLVVLGELTIRGLQVFRENPHPAISGSLKSKESSSLFGLADKTKSFHGKRLLRKWFHFPLADPVTITSRLDAIGGLLEPHAISLHKDMSQALCGIRNVKLSTQKIVQGGFSVNDLANVYNSAVSVLHLRDICCSLEAHKFRNRAFDVLVSTVDTDRIRQLRDLLEESINFADSKVEGKVCIRDGFDQDVDSVRHSYMGLDSFLTDIGIQEMKRLRGEGFLLSKLHVIYYPQIGYLVVLDVEVLEDPSLDTGESNLKRIDLEYMFSSKNHLYYKSKTMYELDNELGDIHGILVVGNQSNK